MTDNQNIYAFTNSKWQTQPVGWNTNYNQRHSFGHSTDPNLGSDSREWVARSMMARRPASQGMYVYPPGTHSGNFRQSTRMTIPSFFGDFVTKLHIVSLADGGVQSRLEVGHRTETDR